MNKICVFWIEDNPLIENIEIRDKTYFPKFIHTDLFSYNLFQHPNEVKEYLSLINKLSEDDSVSQLAEICPDGLPDIVVFDYKLHDNLNTSNTSALQYGDKIQHEFLKTISPNLKIKNCFGHLGNITLFLERLDVIDGNYRTDEFKEELNADKIESDDEFGLYCGISLVKEFKNYITCGVPATINKIDKSAMSYNSLFYEWLNSYDLIKAIDQPSNDINKNWNKILKFSVGLLRNRIFNQIKANKIIPNLSELIQYSEATIPSNPAEKVFSFSSIYGTKQLPLDGLFIDKAKETINDEIINWAKLLVSNYKSMEYTTAKRASNTLIKAYKSDSLIKNRIKLSELVVKLCNHDKLDNIESLELENLKKIFGINHTQINASIENKPAENSNIVSNIVDFRDIKTNNNLVDRLIVLFTDIQLHKIWQNFCEKNRNSKLDSDILQQLKRNPTLEDLRVALYPIPKNPLILPYHQHLLNDSKYRKKDPFEVWDTHLGRNKMSENALYPKSEYPNNLNSTEIQLCKSFALEISLLTPYLPAWLTKTKKL